MKISILDILTIIFVILKLTGVIAWSWWLVLLPSIIGVAVFFIVMSVIGAGTVAFLNLDKKAKNKKR